MVTMQKRNEPAVQTFTLPINSVTGDGQEEDPEQKAKVSTNYLLVKSQKSANIVILQNAKVSIIFCSGQWNQCGLKSISHRIKLYFYSDL